MIVNFVMSSYVRSSIFEHIIGYFRQYSKHRIIVTKGAIEGADVYYYFRPHLEQKLCPNSIVTVHHDLGETDPSLAIEHFLPRYREAKLIVCLNSHQQKILAEHGLAHTCVIPHGYNAQNLFPTKKRNVKKTIGFFSHTYAREVKGETYFLNLLARLSKEECKVILAGKKRSSLGQEIHALGFECDIYEVLPYHYYQQLYGMIDLLLITSQFEGGPASIPEAIATNTPVLSTKVGMVHDMLENPNIHLLSGDVEVDSTAVAKIGYVEGYTQHLYTWQKVIERYDQFFVQLVQCFPGREKSQIKKIIHYFDSQKKKVDFFYHSLYFKKRLKEKSIQIQNIYSLKCRLHKKGAQ